MHVVFIFRRKTYTLHTGEEKKTYFESEKTRLDSVENIEVRSGRTVLDCRNYFPNVIALMLSSFDSNFYRSWTILDRILPLQQLTKLIIDDDTIEFEKIVQLLNLTPNLYTLIVKLRSLNINREKNASSYLVSNIKHLNIGLPLRFEKLKLFISLCPRLEHLTTSIFEDSFQSVLQYLLSKDNISTRHLFSLLITNMSESQTELLKSLVQSNKLQGDYFMEQRNDYCVNTYFWW